MPCPKFDLHKRQHPKGGVHTLGILTGKSLELSAFEMDVLTRPMGVINRYVSEGYTRLYELESHAHYGID